MDKAKNIAIFFLVEDSNTVVIGGGNGILNIESLSECIITPSHF
jgi:diacylglycerol kinase family enzyme